MDPDPGHRVSAQEPDDHGPRAPRTSRARRPTVPGWVWLVLILVGFALLVTSQWTRFDNREITVDAWSCTSTPGVEQSWSTLRAAGCRPADVDAEITVLHSVSPVTDGVGPDPLTVPSVDGEAVDLGIGVRLQTPATAIVLVDASTDPPTPGQALSGDAAGLRWTAPFDPAESEDFVLLVGPTPGAG
jgi:hypothetical protein